MKVIKEGKTVRYRLYSQRLPEELLNRLENEAKKHKMSRNKLSAAILRQALEDPNYVLRVKE